MSLASAAGLSTPGKWPPNWTSNAGIHSISITSSHCLFPEVRLTVVVDQVANRRHQLLRVKQNVVLKVGKQQRLLAPGGSESVREAVGILGVNKGGGVECLCQVVQGHMPENLIVRHEGRAGASSWVGPCCSVSIIIWIYYNNDWG